MNHIWKQGSFGERILFNYVLNISFDEQMFNTKMRSCQSYHLGEKEIYCLNTAMNRVEFITDG